MACVGCPGCDGGGSCTEPGISGCVTCDPAPGGWLVKLRGFTNSIVCLDCVDLDGDYVCVYQTNAEGVCTWLYVSDITLCQIDGIHFQISVVITGTYCTVTVQSDFSGGPMVFTFVLPFGTFDCLGVNSIPWVSDSDGRCVGSGATCTVEPVAIALTSSCFPAAPSGYTLCPWPTLTGTGCLPGGNCADYNSKACLAWVSNNRWESNRRTIDCTMTYGVVVDAQWVMTFALVSGNIAVTLNLYVYLTGTSTLVATIVSYTGTITSGSCGSAIRLNKSFDGGQCGNWPCTITVDPLCCSSCPAVLCFDPCCLTPTLGKPAPPNAIVHGIAFTNCTGSNCSGCTDCATTFDGSDWILSYGVSSPNGFCVWLSAPLSFCGGGGNGARFLMYISEPNVYILGDTGAVFNFTQRYLFAVWQCPISSFSCDLGATNTFTRITPISNSNPYIPPGTSENDDVGHYFCTAPLTLTQSWSL